MWLSSTYICPVKGLAGLESPDPVVLGRAGRTARGLGLDRLVLPVLEESLLQAERYRIRFLDGLIRCLDHAEDAGMSIQLMVPAQRVMGVDWVAPYLVRGSPDTGAASVFVDGSIRPLRPFAWWADPSMVRKRLACFREVTAALSGHPAVVGWIVLDRCLEWPRPDAQTADLILKSYCAEIRARDEVGRIDLRIGIAELMDPKLVQGLTGQVDGLFLRGIEAGIGGGMRCRDLSEEFSLTAFFISMARWLFERPVAAEIGRTLTEVGIRDETLASAPILGQQEASGVTWLNLMDPERHLLFRPPWSCGDGVEKTGLLNQWGDPKDGVDVLVQEMGAGEQRACVTDFIDVDQTEYMADSEAHLRRLWDHFREATA